MNQENVLKSPFQGFTILSIGYDLTPLQLKHKKLKTKGYTIIAVKDAAQAFVEIPAVSYDLAMIGAAVSAVDRFWLIQLIRHKSSVPILIILPDTSARTQNLGAGCFVVVEGEYATSEIPKESSCNRCDFGSDDPKEVVQ